MGANEFVTSQLIDKSICLITITRSQALNALNALVIHQINNLVDRAESDTDIRVIVITGSGTKAFCSGADIGELRDLSLKAARSQLEAGNTLMNRLAALEKPTIAAVNGVAIGGGFELALACTMMILSDNAKIGLPEVTLGLIPGYGGTQRLPPLIGRQRAARLMLTGELLTADEAFALGIGISAPLPSASFTDGVLKLARRLAEQSPSAVSSILASMSDSYDLQTRIMRELSLASTALSSTDGKSGIDKFLDKKRELQSR